MFFLSIISHSSHPRRVESSRSCSKQSALRTKSCKRLRQTVCATYGPWRCEPKSLHFNKVNQKHHSTPNHTPMFNCFSTSSRVVDRHHCTSSRYISIQIKFCASSPPLRTLLFDKRANDREREANMFPSD